MTRKHSIMYSKTIIYFFLGCLCICCDSAFVDTIQKCDVNDEKCVMELYMTSLDKIANTGIPELNIPRLNPLVLKNYYISVLGILDITLVEATVTGITDCVYSAHKIDLEKKRFVTDITCDSFTLESQYKATSGPLVQSALGDAMHGDGHGKVVLEKMHLTYDFAFGLEKDDKGDIYFKPNHAESTYTFEVLGKATFDADNFYLGSQEISKIIIVFFNEKWPYIIKSLGKFFSDKAIEVYFDYIGRFFNFVPAKMFLTNDLTQYVQP